MAEDFCNNCGLCCMHMRTPPFIGDADPHWIKLSKALKDEIRNWVMGPSPRYDFMVQFKEKINPCIWLDLVSGKCKHYDLRPQVCRDYKVGCQSCRTLRKEVDLTVKGMPVVKERFR